jgi:hypothetical protein
MIVGRMFRRFRQRRTFERLASRAAADVADDIGAARNELHGLAARTRKALTDMEIPPRPRCPRCGAPLVLRTAHRKPYDGAQFWGCSTYPRCRHLSQLDEFPEASLAAMGRRR